MKIYMLVKYDSVSEEIESIHTDKDEASVNELESLRNNYALKKEEGMKWRIDVIDLDNIE